MPRTPDSGPDRGDSKSFGECLHDSRTPSVMYTAWPARRGVFSAGITARGVQKLYVNQSTVFIIGE
jgi:hypothetical protein